MMKTLLMIALAFQFGFLSANLVIKKPTEYIQPDGTKLSLFVSGDEFYHRVHDAKGYTVLRHPQTGYAVYAVLDGSSIKASEYIVGSIDPSTLGISPGLVLRDPAIDIRRIEQQRAYLDAGTRGLSTSTFNCVVAFLRFSDQTGFPATPSYTTYSDNFNSTSQVSVKDFFEEESFDRMHINSQLYPGQAADGAPLSYENSYSRSHYLPWSSDNLFGYTSADMGTRLWGLMVSLVSDLDEDVVGDVDQNNDGEIDALVVIIRGDADDWGHILWPARWHMDVSCGQINGADVHNFIITMETDWTAGVTCHEMHHNIGFPDLYHYPSEETLPGLSPCGSWDIMCSDTFPPQHTLGYMKWRYGLWMNSINEITPTSTPTVYSLAAVTPDNPYPCYRIPSSDPDQFYMVEYRKKTGRYENSIPGTGLLVYRIQTDCGNGNPDGPPDEVYVYRPGGDIDSDGTVDNAHFSAEVGRTTIHNYTDPKPWLYVNNSSTPDGNLVITNIGSSSGDAIQFTLQNFIPYIWDGSTSTSWNTASNWSQNAVPAADDYVEIPAGCIRYPYITSTTPGSCYHLAVKSGGYLTVFDGTLTVANDYENNGTLLMNNSAGVLDVNRDLKFNTGSTFNVTAAANIYVQRYVEFHAGSTISMSNGILTLDGSIHGYIRTFTPTAIYRLRSDKNDGFASGIGEISTSSLTIKENVYVLAGSAFNHYYAGTTIVQGSFYVYDGAIMNFNQGTLSMEGNANKTIHIVNLSNDLNNLVINKAPGYGVSLSYPIQLYADLTIQSGYLSPGTNTIYIRGDWTNNVGTGGFIESTGKVIVNGGLDQTFSTETFNALELNKSGGALVVPIGSAVSCNSYDWTAGNLSVTGGTFSVTDLADPGIFGTVTLTAGQIDYQQDSGQFCDLCGTLNISGGIFNVHGSAGTNYLSYTPTGTLNMSGGTLDYKHQGLSVSSSYIFNDNITGGTIRTSKGFSVTRTDFNPAGGTIELYGSNDATLFMTTNPGSNFYNVTINKSASREDRDLPDTSWSAEREGISSPSLRTNTVTGSGLLDINGNFRLEAGTFIAPDYIKIAGNWINLAGPEYFTQGTGTQTVEFNGTGYQYCNYPEVFNIVQLNKSAGALRLNLPGADMQCNTYTWANGRIQVWDGMFTAWDLSQNGIFGNYEVMDDGVINLHQDAAQFIDVNGFLTTEGGEINIFGGSGNSFVGSGGAGGFDMVGGVIDFKDKGITIQSVVTPFIFDVTQGALIRLAGSWIDTRGNVCIMDGEVEMYGSTSNTLSSGTGSYFYDLTINKAAAYSVGALSDLRIDGNLTILNSTFNTGNSHVITLGDDVLVYGKLYVGIGSQLRLTGNTDLTVFDGGILESVGSSVNSNYITHNASGYYNLEILPGATVGAHYTYFEYLGVSGVNVHSGAVVNTSYPFSYCTFRNGIIGGTLLTIENAQTLTCNNVSFTTNAGGGAHNVAKTCNQGTVVFNPYAGAFSGTAYENDPDSRLFWGTGIQKVPTPTITYDENQNQIWLDWVYPIPYTSFKIYRSLYPDGPWISHSTSTTTSWHETLPGPHYLYRITAIGP
jgi:M6 family metalloprotease-like protein